MSLWMVSPFLLGILLKAQIMAGGEVGGEEGFGRSRNLFQYYNFSFVHRVSFHSFW